MSEYSGLLRYAKIVLKDADYAQDVVQDTFHEAVRKADVLAVHPNPAAWLMQTLKFKIMYAKRERSNDAKHLISLEIALVPDKINLVDSKLELKEVVSFLRDVLSHEYFYIFQRYFFDGASHTQIAEELGITVWASRKRLERIRRELRNQFPERRSKNKKNFKVFCHLLFLLGML